MWILRRQSAAAMPPSPLLLLATAAALTAPTSRRWTWAHSGGGPVDIHYTACGPADARSCVVFAPGFGAGSFQFEEVASLVAARGHAVYCMDWFGQGASWPDEARAGARFGIESWARQLTDFLASEELARHGAVFVAGNSVGGLTAAVAAARGEARVDGLVLLNPTPFWSFWGPGGSPFWDGALPAPGPLRAFAAAWFDALRSPAVVRSLLSEVYATKDACDEALAAQICDAASHPVGPDAFASILFSGRSRLEFADALEALAGKRDLRLALIYGKEDPWIQPVWGQRAARRLARAGAAFDYVECSPSGHCPHHETPRAVDAALGHLLGAWTGEAAPPPLPAEPVVERDGRRVSVAACDGEPRGLVERVAALASSNI